MLTQTISESERKNTEPVGGGFFNCLFGYMYNVTKIMRGPEVGDESLFLLLGGSSVNADNNGVVPLIWLKRHLRRGKTIVEDGLHHKKDRRRNGYLTFDQLSSNIMV